MTDQKETLTILFSTDVYGLDTIKKAAYRLLDRAVIEISLRDKEVICTIRSREKEDAADLQNVADEFHAEVLDQDLRQLIADETANVRNAVLAFAFSRTGLQDSDWKIPIRRTLRKAPGWRL